MDIELFYTDHGRKDDTTPLVLLHGNGGNSSSFFYVVDHFTKERRVLTVDTRGHGRTPKGTAPFTLAQFAEDLKCFLDKMNLKKVILIGYSDGGNIAMLFALKYSEYLAGMVLNGSNMFPQGLEKKDLGWIKRTYRKASKRLERHPDDERAKETRDFMKLMTDEPRIDPAELGKITCPVLVLVGSHDVIRPSHSKLIADSFPNGSLTVVKGGHGIVKSNSADYNQAVEDFFKANNI